MSDLNKPYTEEQAREELLQKFADVSTDHWTTIAYDFNILKITTLDGGRIEIDFESAFNLALMLLEVEAKRREMSNELLCLSEAHNCGFVLR